MYRELAQCQALKIDDVQIGALSWCQQAAIVQAKELRVLQRLLMHHLRQRQTRTTLPIANPVRQLIGGGDRIEDDTNVRASVA